jgi:osmotically-inducible protein OsmY
MVKARATAATGVLQGGPMTARSGRISEQIARDVAAALSQKVPGGRDGIEIDAQDGVVTLSGTVPSYKVRCAAEDAVHQVPGVRALATRLEVRLPPPTGPSDTALAVAIVHALESQGHIPVDSIDVTVARGWVTLRGQLQDRSQVRAARRLVETLLGVQGVTSQLTVERGASATARVGRQ